MCEFCEDPAKLIEWEMECERKYGWWIHFVEDSKEPLANIHTHNLERKYRHPDLQIVIPLDKEVANSIFWGIVNRIEKGEKFRNGDEIEGIIQNSKIRFALADESERRVLRVIFPDPQGKLKQEEQEEQYKWQWIGTV